MPQSGSLQITGLAWLFIKLITDRYKLIILNKNINKLK